MRIANEAYARMDNVNGDLSALEEKQRKRKFLESH
jgi:hypothetical protein